MRGEVVDRIILKGMTFYGRHGVLPEEKDKGQPFVVDLVLYLDLEQAALADDLGCTVDYSRVFEAVRQIVEGDRFDLIEAMARDISEQVMARFPVTGVRVRVKKPKAPLGGIIQYVAVSMRRWRGRDR
ncbi:MAG: dihydroneopterin aldolase [Bacillota bacterium]|nr:dihydroneopterin aldolase [Bacillota bacterium]